MQKKVQFFYDSGLSGHAVASRAYSEALKLEMKNVECAGIPGAEWKESPDNFLKSENTIFQCFIPPDLQPVPGATNIAIFYHEWTRVPVAWINKLEAFDAVLVSSLYLKEVLEQSGFRGNILYIPVPLESDITKNSWRRNKPFTFLSLGEWHFRKGFHLLIEAFKGAFGEDENYRLIIKTSPDVTYSAASNINIVSNRIDEQALLELYCGSDAYVCTSLAEGFGLPVAEAMACKLPVISPTWSGLSEFCGENRSLEIPFSLIPQPYCSNPDYYAPGQQCGLIDIEGCSEAMKSMVALSSESRQQMAELACQHIRSKFSFENIGKTLVGIMENL